MGALHAICRLVSRPHDQAQKVTNPGMLCNGKRKVRRHTCAVAHTQLVVCFENPREKG